MSKLAGKGYPQAAQAWATGNGCTGDPQDEDVTDTLIERTWDCPADGPVEFFIIEGGGHTWPGMQPALSLLGKSTRRISANDLIWEFFQRHSLP